MHVYRTINTYVEVAIHYLTNASCIEFRGYQVVHVIKQRLQAEKAYPVSCC